MSRAIARLRMVWRGVVADMGSREDPTGEMQLNCDRDCEVVP